MHFTKTSKQAGELREQQIAALTKSMTDQLLGQTSGQRRTYRDLEADVDYVAIVSPAESWPIAYMPYRGGGPDFYRVSVEPAPDGAIWYDTEKVKREISVSDIGTELLQESRSLPLATPPLTDAEVARINAEAMRQARISMGLTPDVPIKPSKGMSMGVAWALLAFVLVSLLMIVVFI